MRNFGGRRSQSQRLRSAHAAQQTPVPNSEQRMRSLRRIPHSFALTPSQPPRRRRAVQESEQRSKITQLKELGRKECSRFNDCADSYRSACADWFCSLVHLSKDNRPQRHPAPQERRKSIFGFATSSLTSCPGADSASARPRIRQ